MSGESRPATVRTADAAAVATVGRRLEASEQDAAGPLMHYGFGTAVGAVYGALAETRPEITRLGGIPFGLGVWASADEIGVPAAGLSKSPWDRPLRAHTYSMLSHAVYGFTTEAVRKAVRARLRWPERYIDHDVRLQTIRAILGPNDPARRSPLRDGCGIRRLRSQLPAQLANRRGALVSR